MSPTATAAPDRAETDDPPSPEDRPVGRAEVMEAVREAATELFAERGPDAVTVREVADRAGVNHALIHRHYGTKEELLRVVLAQAVERMAEAARGTENTGEDIRGVIAALRREEPAIRLLGWALLAGYPIEQIWPEYPAFQRVQTVLGEEQRQTGGRGDREDPRVVVATGTAMLFGWMVFRPFLDRAAGLSEIPGFDDEDVLFEAAQHLLDRAR
ncbi:MAG: TetR/AcrR family transcriptional regulator [Acidimicrobiales bacterium]|nr:TetR/AcrR family transcriptional regulator [Acidimicrobiales bacterium]MCB9374213.1 TetR/AcrR family transcriptional regulator [Microthrixaceae bacterium]